MADELDPTSPTTTDVQPSGQGEPTVDQSPVQPSGQGQEDSSSLYQEALQSVPQELRPHVESHFKEWDKRVAPKLSEAAEYRKKWEPFEGIDFSDLAADDVGSALDFLRVLRDPEQAENAVLALAEQLGIEAVDDDAEATDEGAEDPAEPIDDDIAWIRERRQQEAAQAAADAEGERLLVEFEEVQASHGKPFTDDETQALCELAEKFGPTVPEPLKEAYAVMNRIAGQAESSLVNAKTREPQAANAAGRASTVLPATDDFDEAQKRHQARMRELAASTS